MRVPSGEMATEPGALRRAEPVRVWLRRGSGFAIGVKGAGVPDWANAEAVRAAARSVFERKVMTERLQGMLGKEQRRNAEVRGGKARGGSQRVLGPEFRVRNRSVCGVGAGAG